MVWQSQCEESVPVKNVSGIAVSRRAILSQTDDNERGMHIEDNPLVIPILHFLQEQQQAVSEHQLITHLRARLDSIEGLSDRDQLALFQVHFLVMNALYTLQSDLLAEGMLLEISPLSIVLRPLPTDLPDDPSGMPAADSAAPELAAFYLDLSNLNETDAADVEQLLQQFWRQYIAHNDSAGALAALDLPAGADWPQIRARYRQLSARLHPDRGGDSRQFIRVREAYEVLRRVVGS